MSFFEVVNLYHLVIMSDRMLWPQALKQILIGYCCTRFFTKKLHICKSGIRLPMVHMQFQLNYVDVYGPNRLHGGASSNHV